MKESMRLTFCSTFVRLSLFLQTFLSFLKKYSTAKEAKGSERRRGISWAFSELQNSFKEQYTSNGLSPTMFPLASKSILEWIGNYEVVNQAGGRERGALKNLARAGQTFTFYPLPHIYPCALNQELAQNKSPSKDAPFPQDCERKKWSDWPNRKRLWAMVWGLLCTPVPSPYFDESNKSLPEIKFPLSCYPGQGGERENNVP